VIRWQVQLQLEILIFIITSYLLVQDNNYMAPYMSLGLAIASIWVVYKPAVDVIGGLKPGSYGQRT